LSLVSGNWIEYEGVPKPDGAIFIYMLPAGSVVEPCSPPLGNVVVIHTQADSAYCSESHPGRARDADLSIALETVAHSSGSHSKDRPMNYELRPANESTI